MEQRARFCRHCGAELPPTDPRFCIECGGPIAVATPTALLEPVPQPSSAGAPTVRLANANVEQEVVGGTIKLVSSHAVPPGMWLAADPPGADDIVAVYAPLRAVVGGWSGLIGHGWRPDDAHPPIASGTRMLYHFVAERDWFGGSQSDLQLRLRVRIRAQAESDEGHARRGFRYRSHHDAPMQVARAWWIDRNDQPISAPIPQIQLMAPPRIPRVSDYDETIAELSAPEAHAWVQGGAEQGVFTLLNATQQRTPVGRGLLLAQLQRGWSLGWLFGTPAPRYRLRVQKPFSCAWPQWSQQLRQIRAEAAGLGLDFEADSMIEWWLDRQGYDSVIFTQARQKFEHEQVAIAFRRSQIARIVDDPRRV